MNNDRFKYRVWDKREKRYNDRYVIGSDGWAYELVDVSDEGYDLFCNEEVIIEQCTGLKDRNGKLIYEGDVISRDNGHRKEIRYYQGGFGWWTEYDDFVSFSWHRHLEEILKNHEIIGNIHDKEQK